MNNPKENTKQSLTKFVGYSKFERMANKNRAAAIEGHMNLFANWVTANCMYFETARTKSIHLETKNEGCT